MYDFQQYQQAFTAHIRNPAAHKKPVGVVPARMAVYREAVFNNIADSVSACYPVCQATLGARQWQRLMRTFVAHHAAATPIFREIPQELLTFLHKVDFLPAYLPQLAHYEWAELSVSTQITDGIHCSKKTDLLTEKPQLAPAHLLLEYDFPVHKISAKFKPKTPEKTYLLVYRNAEFNVNFIELNAATFELLKLISLNSMTGEQALASLTEALPTLDTKIVLKFGLQTLQDLANQGAIVGSVKT